MTAYGGLAEAERLRRLVEPPEPNPDEAEQILEALLVLADAFDEEMK